MVSVKTQTEIQTAYIEVQTTHVSVQPQATLVSIETQTIKVREAQTAKTKGEMQDEMEDRRQRDKGKQVSPIFPGIICKEQTERLRNIHTSCCLFMKHPPGETISL